MASAAAAKRQSGLSSGESKAIKRSASGGGASAVAPPSVAMKVTATSTEDAPKAASLSEKRRVAALISWEKRRKSSGKVKKAAKPKPKKAVTVAKRKPTVEAIAVPVTPPKGKKTAMQNDSQPAAAAGAPAAKRPEFGAGPAERAKAARMMKQAKDQENEPTANTDPTASRKAPAYSGEERRQAAKLGWEKRRNPKAKPATATTIRSQAAKLGWERRRKEKEKAAAAAERAAATGVELKDPSEIRRQAAKLGWERRRKPSALESTAGSTSDASSADEAPLSISAQKKAAAATAAEKKVYSAAQRRQAAIAGWERRRNSTGSSPYDMVPSVAKAKAPPQLAPPKPSQPKKDATNVKPYRQGTKRSRRLASESDTNTMSHDTETRRINELVTHLRLTRGWMEFHPSSRHGSGTATYGYIPSSIATFVRAGAISQKTVLDHGTLGVHYALDWDGYGGLRDMINTFGEDYSPYPTEEMVQDSRFTEWELGDDLPWREVAKAEEEKLEKMAAERELRRQEEEKVTTTAEETSSEDINDEDMEDILFVANILTSLDHGANVVANILTSLDRGPANVQHPSAVGSGLEQASNDPTNTMAPSLLAPKTYDESSDDCDFEAKGCISENNPLAHLAKVAATTKECEDEKALLIQTPQDFKQWNFGLS